MPKRETDRFASLAANIRSPRVVADIDRAILENRRELGELLDLRKIAVSRHGGPSDAPVALTEASFAVMAQASQFDGTLGGLAEVYRTDERSGINNAKHSTRTNYANLIKRLVDDQGDKRIADLQESDIRRFYDNWRSGGRDAMAHSLITMLRMILAFGMNKLEDRECARVSTVLRQMRFIPLKKRTERLTKENVVAIRAKANALGFRSLALAQALQFDCGLRQRDVIGQWVPESEFQSGDSEIKNDGKKWVGGLCWDDVDQDYVLHLDTRLIRLSNAPMVMEELASRYPSGSLPRKGAMIVSEATERPWTDHEFRRRWREIATSCGVPQSVRNMDSRTRVRTEKSSLDDTQEQPSAGAPSEGFDAALVQRH